MSAAVSPAPDLAPTPPRPAPAHPGRATGQRARPGVLRLVGAVVAGLLLWSAFAPLAWWWTAPLAVACLQLTVAGARLRAAYGLGVLAGLVFFVPLLSWARVTGDDGWLILSGSQAVLFGVVAVLCALVQRSAHRLRAARVLLGVSGAWVAMEALRGRQPFGGFPWGRLAFSQPDSPYTPLAALGGAPLVTAAVALTGAAVALLITRLAAAAPLRSVVAPGAAVLLSLLAGLLVATPTGGERSLSVAVVQGNVPRLGLSAFDQREAVLTNHITRTQQLVADIAAGRVPRPDLVVWPENSSDIDLFTNPRAAARVSQVSEELGVPILLGVVAGGPRPRTVRNVAAVWGPQGVAPGEYQTYDKRHPVPFAEYLPFRSTLSRYIGRFDTLLPNDFLGGDRPGVLDVGAVRVADVICFEVGYDSLVRDAVRGGGGVLVVQTNNASFGRSPLSRQQLAMSRLRAVEHGRATVVSSTSGLSAVIAPDGRVVQQSELFTADTLVQRVPFRTVSTVADRVGVWPEALLAALALLLAAGGPRRRTPRPAHAPQPS